MAEENIGKVSAFFAKPVVAGITMSGTLKVGDTIHFVGHTTNLTLTVGSMQVNNVNVQEAKAGDEVGIKITDRVRIGDSVFKVAP